MDGLSEISKKQYLNFRKYFYEDLKTPILGEDYYNMACDSFICDMLMIKDLRSKYDKLLYKNKVLSKLLSISIGMMLICLVAAIYFMIVK